MAVDIIARGMAATADERAGMVQSLVVEEYDSTQTYNPNNIVFYNGKLYLCVGTNVTGTFDPTQWQQIVISDELTEIINKLATMTNPMIIKGRVDTVNDLPVDAEVGWVYFVGLVGASEMEEYVYTDNDTWEYIGTSQIMVDDALSDVSTNPVQNKVITKALNTKYNKEDDVAISMAQYQALGDEKYYDGKNYYIYDADTPTSDTIIYGWHVDPDESDPAAAITYLEDAVGMTPAAMGSTTFSYGSWENAFFMPKPCMLKSDGTVDYYLNPNDYTQKLDGTASDIDDLSYDGNVMIEWPLIFWKYEAGSAEGEGYFYVSNRRVDDSFNCWCNYDADGNIIPHFYTAAYNALIYDGKMRSISGYKTAEVVETSYSQNSTYAVGDKVLIDMKQYQCITAIETPEPFDESKWTQIPYNNGMRMSEDVDFALENNLTDKEEWNIEVFADRMLINGLLILIGKSLDTQAVFGKGMCQVNGTTVGNYTTGTANQLGLFWGRTSLNNLQVKVFGIENYWGLVFRRTLGLYIASNGYKYKLTYSTIDGSTTEGYNGDGTGYIESGADYSVYSKSYIVKCKYGKFGYLPIELTSGSSSTYYADTHNGGRSCCVMYGGGNANAGGCGATAFDNVTYTSAATGYSSCLSCKPLKGGNQ